MLNPCRNINSLAFTQCICSRISNYISVWEFLNIKEGQYIFFWIKIFQTDTQTPWQIWRPPNFDSMATALINVIVGLILFLFFYIDGIILYSIYVFFSFFYRYKDLWSIVIETDY